MDSNLDRSIQKQRAKVYHLNDNGKWEDQGTGHVIVDPVEGSEYHGFVLVEEDNEILLLHRITADDIYRKQEDTTISWRDPGCYIDLALKFQETSGCSYIWDQICNVQRNIRSQSTGRKDISVGYNHHSGYSSSGLDVEIHHIDEICQQALQNDGISTITNEKGQENTQCDMSNLVSSEWIDNQSASQSGQFPPSNNGKSKTQKFDLPLEKIEPFLSKTMKLVDAAKQLGVSRSTMKRKLKKYNISWPSSKRRKQSDDAKVGEPDTNLPFLEKPSVPARYELEPKVSKGAFATMEIVHKSPLENIKKSLVAVHQLDEVHSNGANQLNIAQPNKSLRTFDFVKASYTPMKLQVKINFSLTSSVDQLHEYIGKKFGLKVNRFNIEYLDEDEEWNLMTSISDLDDALLHTSRSGKKFIRLSITDKRMQNTGQHSEQFLELLTPTKSEGGKFIQQPKRYIFPYYYEVVPCILPFIKGYTDVEPDGNCGFRTIALFVYDDEEKWVDVRRDLMIELTTHEELYKRALGGDEVFKKACQVIRWYEPLVAAPKEHWYEASNLGMVVATKYQKIFTYWSKQCPTTFFPLEVRLGDQPPTEYINMTRVNNNHFIALHMTTTDIPLPQPTALWMSNCEPGVKYWFLFHFRKQLDCYTNRVNSTMTTILLGK